MKVLFFIPTLSNGGAERVLCNLVDKLVTHKDINIDVLTCLRTIEINCRQMWGTVIFGNVNLEVTCNY